MLGIFGMLNLRTVVVGAVVVVVAVVVEDVKNSGAVVVSGVDVVYVSVARTMGSSVSQKLRLPTLVHVETNK